MTRPTLTRYGVRQDIDSERTALANYLIQLFETGDRAGCRAGLSVVAFLQPSIFQQLMLAAPGLRSVLD